MKLLRFLFKYSPSIILLTALVGVVGGVASAWLLPIINSHLTGAASASEDLWLFIVLCLAILVASVAARASICGLARWSSFDLRLQLGRQWVGTPLAQLERQGGGKLLGAVTQDVERLAEAMRALPGLCIDITVILCCLGYLAYVSWLGFVIMLGFMATAVVTRQIPQKKCDELVRQARVFGETMLATFNAMKSGIKELKMNRARWNAFYVGELYETSSKFRDTHYKADLIYGAIRGYSEIIYFMFVALLIYGSPSMPTFTPDKLLGFAMTVLFVKTNLDHVLESSGLFTRAQHALVNLESFGVFQHASSMSISDLRTRTARSRVAVAVAADIGVGRTPTLQSHIRFGGVEYQYPDSDGESGFTLGPIDLAIRSRELLFVTGGNGSGKTTFAKILCGLYEPSKGEIWLDDVKIDASNRNWYTQHFGTVFTDSHLFDKLYGTEDLPATDETVSEYLKEFRLQHKVKIKDGRFSTTSLSQGQRKRLALITAYVEDRPLYMFDEWAADQDPEFRQFFYLTILPKLKKKGKTVIVISHDDRYYHVADRVAKFEGGKLITELPPTGAGALVTVADLDRAVVAPIAVPTVSVPQ